MPDRTRDDAELGDSLEFRMNQAKTRWQATQWGEPGVAVSANSRPRDCRNLNTVWRRAKRLARAFVLDLSAQNDRVCSASSAGKTCDDGLFSPTTRRGDYEK
jgi:hypothetical protein